jgi:hypothetical protein
MIPSNGNISTRPSITTRAMKSVSIRIWIFRFDSGRLSLNDVIFKFFLAILITSSALQNSITYFRGNVNNFLPTNYDIFHTEKMV